MVTLIFLIPGKIQENFCPVLYRIGLHHVATFVKKYDGEAAAEKLKRKIESIGNEVCLFSDDPTYFFLHSYMGIVMLRHSFIQLIF